MPTTLDKLFLSIAEKAGIDPSDSRIAETLAHTELNRIPVHDELVADLQKKLISLAGAKNNHPDVRKHYYGQNMSFVEQALDEVFQEYGFTPDEIAEINKEERAPRRIPLAISKLKAKLAGAEGDEKGKGKGNADLEALRQQNAELNNKLAKLNADLEKERQEAVAKFTNFKKDMKLDELLDQQKTVFDYLPRDARRAALRTILFKEFQDNALDAILDERENLGLLRKDGAGAFDETHKPQTIDDFVAKTFAKNKVLQQNNAAGGTNGVQADPQGQLAGAAGGQQKNAKYAGLYAETKKSLEQNPVQMV